MSNRFASSYLEKYPDKKDWVCVYDFGGTCSLLHHVVNLTAWWSPSRKIVAFGNNWHDVPDMPASSEPTEAAVDRWVREHPGYLQRKVDVALARRKSWQEKSKETACFYKKHGKGKCHVELRSPEGVVRVIDEPCGIRGPLNMLPTVTMWMVQNMPAGSVLQKLTVSRKKPAHRGELKTTV